VARYEQLFAWRPEQAQLLAPAEIGAGHRVLDFGCGPGFMTRAIAEMVGPSGAAVGVDINARFVAEASARDDNPDNLAYTHLDGVNLPLDDGAFDRALCKNVLEYVPDLKGTLAELYRVLAPGGKAHAIDSDWGFVIVEPWEKDEVDRFFTAAAPAFKEPYIGRRLPAALGAAGFREIQVTVLTAADRKGRAFPVLRNMESYIRQFDTLPEAELAELMDRAERAVDAGTFMLCLPQFLVTAER
jgi:ubiquinone/menaquinone biosynthesis C-methylase UbiE